MTQYYKLDRKGPEKHWQMPTDNKKWNTKAQL